MAKLRRALNCIVFLGFAKLAYAAHPFITDDPKTQGKGNFELQLGTQFSRTGNDGTTLSAFQFSPQLSYGLVDTVDLQIRPNYNVAFSTGVDPQHASGFGDVFAGVKWRFFDSGALTSAIGAGSGFPVGNAARGLDAGQSTPFAYLIGMYATEAIQIQSAVGAIRNAAIPDGRGWLAHVSAAALWRPRPGLQVGIDVIADQNPIKSAAQWPAGALVGLIYTVTKFLDLDVGYQRGLNQSAPDNQYLFGATFRW
jgi:hypothetical protein